MDFYKLRHLIFFGLLTLVSIIFLYIIKPFAYPIFWAAIIASLFYPAYTKLNKYLKIPNLSTSLTLIIILLVIILPLFLAGYLLISESINIYTSLDNNREQINTGINNFTVWVQNNSYTKNINFNEAFWVEKISDATKTFTNFIFIAIKKITQNSLRFLAMSIIMFYTLFFFIRDGEKMLKTLMHLCPLGDKYEKMLYNKFTSTAKSALKGTIVIGSIQGILGAILFWITGIPGVLIWGLVMAGFSTIPPLSSAIVWFPAGVILLLTGKIWEGSLILIFGLVVISTIDNILRPLLIGKETSLHPVLILISTLGGLIIFGISGFIIGPIIASLFVAFWEMYEHYYKNELCNNK